jgi:rRNA-processing protein FCF1
MSIPLYMDVHIPIAITAELRRRGVDVLTAQEDDATRMNDDELLERAKKLGRVLFSMDADLRREAARRQQAGIAFCRSGRGRSARHLRRTVHRRSGADR